MRQLWMIGVPLLAAAAALLGVLVTDRPAVAIAVASAAGIVVAYSLAVVVERRLGRVTEEILRLAEADPDTRDRVRPRRLEGALSAVGVSLRERIDALAGERGRIERLLDDLPLAVMLFTNGNLAYANPAAGRLLPTTAGEGLSDAVTEASETGRAIEVDLTAGGRDLRARASPTAPGEVAVVVSDLTETRRVDAMRRAFVTNASHELKTPVAGMQALADSLLLAIERDPERARRMIERLRGEAVRLARLVRELLDLARLEEATAQRARRIELSALVSTQVDRLAGLAERRGITFTTDLDPAASIVAVPEDVRLIVGNLIDNAVRYNRDNGEVRVRLRRGGGHVSLDVSDTGIGIPAADQDRVFERFYRVDKARSRAAGGTGLGLSLVRHATERLGGTVTLTSEPGAGTTFAVVLPVEGLPLDQG